MLTQIYDFVNSINFKKRKTLAFLSYLVLLGLMFLIFKNIIFSLFLTIFTYFVISEMLKSINIKRKDLLLHQLIKLITNIVIMLRAGISLRSALKNNIALIENPLKKYLKKLIYELEAGNYFDIALDRFAFNCSIREAVLITTALKINNKIGGNLIFILNNLIEQLQESIKSKLNSKTLTLQAKYSGNIIAVMPVIIIIIMFFVLDLQVSNFFNSKIGTIFLLAGAFFELTGLVVIRKILSLD